MSDLISRQAAVELIHTMYPSAPIMRRNRERWEKKYKPYIEAEKALEQLPSAQPEIVWCKDCKHWKQQTNYQRSPLSFGFCESDDMWRSLYGETYEVAHIDTDDDHYCGYAERRTDE